jgi:hypothetical protein
MEICGNEKADLPRRRHRPIVANATEGDKTEAIAAVYGAYLAMSADCGLPMARVEKGFDRYLDAVGVGPLEASRLRGVMMHFRGVTRGVAAVDGCGSAKAKIDKWLGQ